MNKDVVLEALKEVARWVVLFVLSWFVSETIKQATSVPEFFALKVWVFVYMIPVRASFMLGLTVLGRVVDRWVHDTPKLSLKGILPF